jgi:hypothetical protein
MRGTENDTIVHLFPFRVCKTPSETGSWSRAAVRLALSPDLWLAKSLSELKTERFRAFV